VSEATNCDDKEDLSWWGSHDKKFYLRRNSQVVCSVNFLSGLRPKLGLKEDLRQHEEIYGLL
jgi:hypothetical protein